MKQVENTLSQIPGYYIDKHGWEEVLRVYGPLTNMLEFCLGPIEYNKLLINNKEQYGNTR